MKVLTCEASKGYKKKTRYIMIKTMDKNAQMERIYHDQQLQVYMYDFMYVELDTMPPEDNFSDTRTFVDNYKKMSTPGPVPKN